MSTTFKIDKGVPLPPAHQRGGKGRSMYPLADMAVGDSCYVPSRKGESSDATMRRVGQSFYSYARKNNIKVTVRTEPLGVRVWRVA